ncbi:UDP-2,4-diacetamido-2,4,6-trideoxy-beta-L-altropyranose hydrolase [Phocaeicola sp.]
MRKIYFRADASLDIGYGHFMRTLALANMLKDDFNCTFFTCHPTSYQVGEMEKVCPFIVLDEITHFDDFLSYLSGGEIIVLDNYFFTTNYQKKIKAKGCNLVCVDDMHDKHYVADIVINHGVTNEALFSVEPYTQLCLGYNWALLRKAFLKELSKQRNYTHIAKAVVCFGGSDQYHLTEKFIEYLQREPSIKEIIAVVGDRYQADVTSKEKVSYVRNLSANEMSVLFQNCDIAFLPSSTVCMEALSQQIPVVSGYYVDNQKEMYATYVANGLIYPLGDLLNLDLFAIDFSSILASIPLLHKVCMSEVIQRYRVMFSNLFDLKRLSIDNYEFVDYRLLSEDQHKMIWNARNDDAIRSQMEHPEIISWDSHLGFVKSLLNKYRKVYLAVYRDGTLVGSVNYEFGLFTQVERGIFIIPSFWGEGDSVRIECALFEILKTQGVKSVIAKVLKSNLRSYKFHLKLGYKETSSDDRYNYLIKEID